MNCLTGEQKWPQFVREHFADIRAPFSAGIELLPECNFRCIHCYAASERCNGSVSMTTKQIYSIIDTLVDHNCMELYFTGGECLSHKDFFDIYKYVKRKGVLVSVLTNGSLISQKHIDLWLEYPPELVSISLYGATPETYERITRNPKGYQQVMNAISLLQKNSIHFELKIIGMKQNYDDILTMRKFIRDCGQINSILAWDIRPMNDGDCGPIDCRVSPEESMKIELQDSERKAFLDRLAFDKTRNQKTERQRGGYLYPCAAGFQFVFITHDGHMQSCVKAVEPRYDLLNGNFDEGWKYLGEEYVEKKASANFKCLKCDKLRYCGQCSAAFASEMGNPEIPVPFYCERGELMKQYMNKVADGQND